MATNREQWIDDVMASASGISRAQPSPGFYEGVSAKISAPVATRTIAIPLKQWVAAAVLLVAINIGSVIYFTTRNSRAAVSNNVNPFAAELQEGSTYNY